MTKNSNLMGLVFANTHDNQISDLTKKRAMASVPFAGRYRLIDFSLSNLASAEITKVGVIARKNYMSLIDHIGSGKSYSLARKNGGLFILPPNVAGADKIYHGHLQAIYDIYDFLDMAKEEYVVLADADVISNIDIKKMFKQHRSTGADVTVAYKHGTPPVGHGDTVKFDFDDSGKVVDVELAPDVNVMCNYSLDIMIFNKRRLFSLVNDAHDSGLESISKDIIKRLYQVLDIRGYEVTNYTAVIDSMKTFFNANLEMLDADNRYEALRSHHIVSTKVHDETPVIYRLNSSVKNSLIADGCVIDGVVENSVIFRGVKVASGAVVKNCVIMNNCEIGENAQLEYVCAERDIKIDYNKKLSGDKENALFIDSDC